MSKNEEGRSSIECLRPPDRIDERRLVAILNIVYYISPGEKRLNRSGHPHTNAEVTAGRDAR
mgnify:CR=1 FL=1